MPFKFKGELVQVPYADLRLVGPSRDRMVPVSGCLNLVTCFREVEMLNELDCSFDLFPDYPLSFPLGLTFLGKPVRE